MSADWLAKPAGPLFALARALGDSAPDWSERESLEELVVEEPHFDRAAAARLRAEDLLPLLEAYGDALAFQFLLGDQESAIEVFNIHESPLPGALDRLQRDTASAAQVIFRLRLDKQRLAQRWFGASLEQAGICCRVILYLFPDPLEKLLRRSDLLTLEALFWPAGSPQQVAVCLPEPNLLITGPYLALCDSAALRNPTGLFSPAGLPSDEPVDFYDQCREATRWQEVWLRRITPLHLYLQPAFEADDSAPLDRGRFSEPLATHFLNALLLYTADRTTVQAGPGSGERQLVSTFSGTQQSVEIPAGDPAAVHWTAAEYARLPALRQVFAFVYESDWKASDRLPLLQIAAAQALRALLPAERRARLALTAPALLETLENYWKNFLEGRIEAFIGQVQSLEDAASETARGYATQVTALVKSLSDTVLAAVGVVIGTFIAALFRDKFNPLIFQLGMFTYAIYVLLFPLAYNMFNQWGAFLAQGRDFDARNRRFVERLPEKKVAQIIHEAGVEEAGLRFRRWFWATLVSYMVVIAVLLYGGLVVPTLF